METVEQLPNEEDRPADLLPCYVCGRTFVALSLKKHQKVCEKSTIKKRKPFDSLKQRVEGTDIAQFHQKTYLKKPEPVQEIRKPKKNTWKEKHLELLNSIRAAKGIPSDIDNQTPTMRSTSSFQADTERCPSCCRQFGPKAYDRHVEWCKEKKANQRIQNSPANVLLAKERLEARIKYVPPLNKTRKTPVREKYSNQSPSPGKTESTTSLVSQPSIRRKAKVDSNLARSRQKTVVREKRENPRKNLEKMFDDKEEDVSERSYEHMNSKLPAIMTSPKTDFMKSSLLHKKRSFPLIKTNKANINSQVDGITVASMKYDVVSKKLVTWSDTVKSQSDNNMRSNHTENSEHSVNIFNKHMQNLTGKFTSQPCQKIKPDSCHVNKIKSQNGSSQKPNSVTDSLLEFLPEVETRTVPSKFIRNEKKNQKKITESLLTSSISPTSDDTDNLSELNDPFIDLKSVDGKNPNVSDNSNIINKIGTISKSKKSSKSKNILKKPNKENCSLNEKRTSSNTKVPNSKLDEVAVVKADMQNVILQRNVESQDSITIGVPEIALEYTWKKESVDPGLIEKDIIDLDLNEDFSFSKLITKYNRSEGTSSSAITSDITLESCNDDLVSLAIGESDLSVPYIKTSPLKCSATKLDIMDSRETMCSAVEDTISNDSFAETDLKSYAKFDWTSGEFPKFTKSILKENLFPSKSDIPKRIEFKCSPAPSGTNTESVNSFDEKDQLNSGDSEVKSSESSTAIFSKVVVNDSSGKNEEDNNTATDSFVFLYQSPHTKLMNTKIVGQNKNVINKESLEHTTGVIYDSNSKRTSLLEKSFSDININNSSNSKNTLVSIFSSHCKDFDVESINSRKMAIRSLPNMPFEAADRKVEPDIEGKYDTEDTRESKRNMKRISSKDMVRTRTVETETEYFPHDFITSRSVKDLEIFADQDYSVPKKKRKLQSNISLKSSLDYNIPEVKKKKLMRTKKEYRNYLRKNAEEFFDSNDCPDKIQSGGIPKKLLPLRSERSQNRLDPTKNDNASFQNHQANDIDIVIKSPSIQDYKNNKSVGIQLKLPPIVSQNKSVNNEKAVQVNFFERLPRCLDENYVGSKYFLKSSASRSYSTEKLVKVERRDSLASLNKFSNTDASTSVKNRKNSRGTKLEEQEQSKGDWFNINNELKSSEYSLKPEDLFAVDDAMYEEFKKYEEMYLKGRKEKNSSKKQKPKLIEINYKILTSGEENQSSHLNNKVSTDSAYGSLTRNTPEHRNIIPNHLPLEETILDNTVLNESVKRFSPTNQDHRIPKFCHECGSRYPVSTAKFCVECGVRRLIL